jgi:N6-adenosine-specific RNA methylase IME4
VGELLKPRQRPGQAARAIADIIVGKRHRRDLGDIAGLAASMAEPGLLQPIVIRPDGTLIAGERRLRAAELLGWRKIPVTVVDLDAVVKGEYAENAYRKNFLPSEIDSIRRDMEPLEKAAAKERMLAGRPSGKFPEGQTRDKIAAFAGTSGRTLDKIKHVMDAAEKDPKRFGPLVEEMDRTGKVDWVYSKVRRADRLERLVEISKAPLPRDRKYPIILADPPWQFGMYEQGIRAPENHYGTMPLDDICALPVPEVATPDAVLFLWVPSALLFSHAAPVLEAWGFTYRVNIVWVKDNELGEKARRAGLGFYVRAHHELLLIATCGERILPDPSDLPSSVIYAPRREHSRKPDEAYALIEAMYPDLPKIELFARGKREGWAVWGNEVPAAVEPPPDSGEMPDIPACLRRAP